MIAHSLAETLIFLESRSHNDADFEYLQSIRQMIIEHAAMREALEHIRDLTDSSFVQSLADTTLQKGTITTDPTQLVSVQQVLDLLSQALPSEEQLEALRKAGVMIRAGKREIT